MMMEHKKNIKGFTLMEMIVASSILLIIVASIYALIIRTQHTHLTEGRRLDMNQAARALEVLLYDNLRSAGSVLSLLHTPSFVGAPVTFTGIYPLNNLNFPDGIIIASGDPMGSTQSSVSFDPSSDNSISVASTDLFDMSGSAWQINDHGIIIIPEGYYVFRVTQTPALGAGTLSIRATPVYYSGLLNTTNYNDLTDEHNSDANKTGLSYTYPAGSPVIRLQYFNIFLVRETDGVRTLTITTDTQGVADVLNPANETNTRGVPFVPNILDIQFEYITRGVPADFWAASATDGLGGTSYANPCASAADASCMDFMQQFQNRNIASVRVYALFRTEEEVEKSAGSGMVFDKPRMGDQPAVRIPVARYHYSYMTYEVQVRNYNIIY